MPADRPPTQHSSLLARRPDLIVLAAFIAAVAAGSLMGLFQWDTEAYFWAGRAWMTGADPYDLMLLTKMTGKPPLPFVYPPTVLPFIGILSLLPLPLFHLVFLAAKVGALILLIRCWRRIVGEHAGNLVWFAMLGFHGALFSDLGAGNIAVFEALLVWLALEAWIDGRTERFAALIVLAGQPKLAPLAFISLLTWRSPRHGRTLAMSVAGLAALTGVLVAVAPESWSRFFSLAASIDERGLNNQSQVALWRDLLGVPIGSVASGKALIPSLLVSFAVGLATWRVGYRASAEGEEARRRAVFLAVLAYALVVPRFKSYSYLLLTPAAVEAFGRAPSYKIAKYVFLVTGLMPFMPFSDRLPLAIAYLPLAWAAWFWWLLIRRGEAPDRTTAV
ncbi:MAG TPA: glycosyltransferase family 87 protein [Candidatus Ozemobacteraceae bacterium]|nr:glycosyltransferase family 87 protein [Candidatus Ozemobacteraceae bacterium]HQG27220.1 glycosyltransferase family 87 protein [Candidatus Ozemobacteraceae bacterium]